VQLSTADLMITAFDARLKIVDIYSVVLTISLATAFGFDTLFQWYGTTLRRDPSRN